ncbi:MAG: hypothetical protein MJB14_00275 [Spirochaetes bacterium]|nr:hypothetical protein [Spirochaetota bacterium]
MGKLLINILRELNIHLVDIPGFYDITSDNLSPLELQLIKVAREKDLTDKQLKGLINLIFYFTEEK